MPVINKPNQHFDINLWTGTGSAGQVQTNSGSMQPDFVWIKNRSSTGGHWWSDSVRGAASYLSSQNTDAEANSATGLSSFNSNGFTVGSDSWTGGNGATYVGWQWKAGGTAVTNTSGTITSQVSANPTAGFSIVAWTGNGSSSATVGHGLGAVPALIICKERSAAAEYWHVKHKSTASNTNLFLNVQNGSTSASSVGDGVLGDLSSSTTFGFATAGSPGNVVAVNENGVTNIAYCWSEVPGYSSFGTFSGNGASNGPFIYTGFKPKFFLYKATSHSSDWWLLDGTRGPINSAGAYVFTNANTAEGVESSWVDFVSNGIKLRGRTDPNTNGSDRTYIYMAFAESPFKFANAR